MSDNYRGVTYSNSQVYKVLRVGNAKGGGSKVSAKEFDDKILGLAYTTMVIKFHDLLPSDDEALIIEDKILPDVIFDMSWDIKRFLDKHGPFSPLAIGLMTCIIDMDKMGITDSKTYFSLLDYLDENPAVDLKDYIEKLTKFERELE